MGKDLVRDCEYARKVSDGNHRTVIRTIAAGTFLLPLRDDQPRRHDGKIRRDEHAEGIFVGFFSFEISFLVSINSSRSVSRLPLIPASYSSWV